MLGIRWTAAVAASVLLPFAPTRADQKKDVQEKFANMIKNSGGMPFARGLQKKIDEGKGKKEHANFGAFEVQVVDTEDGDGFTKPPCADVVDSPTPWKCPVKGRVVKAKTTTTYRFDGPQEGHGAKEWPRLEVKNQVLVDKGDGKKGDWEPKNTGKKDDDVHDYSDEYMQKAQEALGGAACEQPDHVIWKTGACLDENGNDLGKYDPLTEPRVATVDETLTFTFKKPGNAQAFLRAIADASPATTLSDILMGFTYEGPNIDYTIGDKREICLWDCYTIYDIRAGFALDFAAGLRLPAVDQLQATQAFDTMIAGQSYGFSSTFTPADWEARDYEEAGVAQEKGNEYVMRMNFFAGAKVIVLGSDVCPYCQYVEFEQDSSQSFTTPFGGTFDVAKIELPLKSWDYGIVTLDLKLFITPQLGSDTIQSAVQPSGAVQGGGTLTYKPQQPTQDFTVKACILGPNPEDHAGAVTLGDFRYWFDKFNINLAIGMNLEVFGYGAWDPTIPIFDFDVSSLTGSLSVGPHWQCNWAFECSPAGPASVSIPTSVSDISPPATAMTVTGDVPGSEGWFRSPALVTLAAADNPPGCGTGVQRTDYAVNGAATTTYAAPVPVDWEGITKVAYRSYDNDGNAEDQNVEAVYVDWTPPDISGAPTTLPNARGWYKNDVVVHFVATDAISLVATFTPDTTVFTDGFGQQVKGEAWDHAGNYASTIVPGINLDKTLPVITIVEPLAKTYLSTDPFVPNWGVTDALSGVLDAAATFDLGPVPANLLLTPGGQHAFTVVAHDNADNQNTATVSLGVDITIDGLIATANYVCGLGWILKDGTCKSLLAKLGEAKISIDAKAWRDASGQLGAFLNELDAQLYKAIVDVRAYEILRLDAEYVLTNHVPTV